MIAELPGALWKCLPHCCLIFCVYSIVVLFGLLVEVHSCDSVLHQCNSDDAGAYWLAV